MNQQREDSKHETNRDDGQLYHHLEKNISGELSITRTKFSFVLELVTGHQIVHKLFKKKTLSLLPKSRGPNPHLIQKYFYTNSLNNLQLSRKQLQRLFRRVVGAQGQPCDPKRDGWSLRW